VEAYETEQSLPAKDRYVQLATVNPSIISPSNGKQLHYAILFSQSMAEALHRDGAHLQMDTTFPFKRGQEEELKEFKIGAMGTSTGRCELIFLLKRFCCTRRLTRYALSSPDTYTSVHERSHD
jgi:hypothetical protein